MEDKSYILNFLHVNGVSSGASDETVRETLKIAKWPEDEIKTALYLFRDKTDGSGIVALTKHDTTLFRSDADLSSEHLSMLLGVDVIVDPALVRDAKTHALVKKKHTTHEILLWSMLIILSACVAAFGGWVMTVLMNAGQYQETTGFFLQYVL